MSETMQEKQEPGRPAIYGEQVNFEMRKWSKDIMDKINAKRGQRSRRAYIEYLLRTHPEMQDQEG